MRIMILIFWKEYKMKYFILLLVAVLLVSGCNNDYDGPGLLEDEASLYGTYLFDDSTHNDIVSGFITFNADNTMSGELLAKNPGNDCIFDGGWSIQYQLILDVYNTTNSVILDFGRNEVHHQLRTNGKLEISLEIDGNRFTFYFVN